MRRPVPAIAAVGIIALIVGAGVPAAAQTGGPLREGKAAFGDWHADAPGTRRLIRPQDLPAPDVAESVSNRVTNVRHDGQKPSVPAGFSIGEFASGLEHPRLIRPAPNGDVFVAESAAGRIRVLRPDGARATQTSIFASDLLGPFGIAFYPPGPNPQWVYVGNTDSVVRFAYRNGDLTARGPAEIVVPHLPVGGHRTRDVVFSPNGQTMFVSVGSGSNVGEDMEKLNGAALANLGRQSSARRRVGTRNRPRRRLDVRPARQAHRNFRHRHPQLRRHGDRPVERHALVLDQ